MLNKHNVLITHPAHNDQHLVRSNPLHCPKQKSGRLTSLLDLVLCGRLVMEGCLTIDLLAWWLMLPSSVNCDGLRFPSYMYIQLEGLDARLSHPEGPS